MRREHPHNTDEQVADYVRSAVQLVDLLEVPEDLRQEAFVAAVNLYAAKQIVFEQVAPLGTLLDGRV